MGISLGQPLSYASTALALTMGVPSFDFRQGMPAGSTYARAGPAAGLTLEGLIQSFAANAPQRTDRGLTLEPAATNLFRQSNAVGESPWVASGAFGDAANTPVVTTNNAMAPDGTTTATRLAYAAVSLAGGYCLVHQDIATTALTYTQSIHLRGDAGGEVIHLMTTPDGESYARLAVTLTTAWQRFELAALLSAPNRYFQYGTDLRDTTQSARPPQTIYAWGAQLEVGPVATSPIVTTSDPATRGLPVFTEPVPAEVTKALLTYADASTTLVTGLTPGGTFDVATAVIGAGKGRFGVSELITRTWQP